MSTDGVLVVDKPADWTSHDVVARIRRLVGTRRVGHAGTLDPMATGVLVVGIGRGTRLLGHLARGEKEYRATIRLGATTTTDDVTGEVVCSVDPAGRGGLDPDAIRAALGELTGEIEQVPPAYSAVQVAGQRAYAAARAGTPLSLAPRRVRVEVFELERIDPNSGDLEVRVVCGSGTYIRALARDLGAALGIGGHLTALRRTRVGPFTLAGAQPPVEPVRPLPLAVAVRAAFPVRQVDADAARLVRHGGRLPATGGPPGPVAVFDPDGALLALVEERGDTAYPLVVLAG